MTGDELRSARWKLGQLWGLPAPNGSLTLDEMADLLGLRGRRPSSSLMDYERGKTQVSGPMALAVEALLSGWKPAGFEQMLERWGWETASEPTPATLDAAS